MAAPSVQRLGFMIIRRAPRYRAFDALHQCLDSCRGVGAVAAGMARQDFDLQLTKYAERGVVGER